MADMANYLVTRGANLNARDAKGRTPVDVCWSIGLDHGPDNVEASHGAEELNGAESSIYTLKNVESPIRTDSPIATDSHSHRKSFGACSSEFDGNSPQRATENWSFDPANCLTPVKGPVSSPSELSVQKKIMYLNKKSARKLMPQSLLSDIRRPQRRNSSANHYREQYEAYCHERSKWRSGRI